MTWIFFSQEESSQQRKVKWSNSRSWKRWGICSPNKWRWVNDNLLFCSLESRGCHQEQDRAGGDTEGQFQPSQAPERGERCWKQEQARIQLQMTCSQFIRTAPTGSLHYTLGKLRNPTGQIQIWILQEENVTWSLSTCRGNEITLNSSIFLFLPIIWIYYVLVFMYWT